MFDIDFNEAMEHLFTYGEKGWIQGEYFGKEYYLSLASSGTVTINRIDDQFSFAKSSTNVLLTKGLMTQKYRVIEVLNYTNVVNKEECDNE